MKTNRASILLAIMLLGVLGAIGIIYGTSLVQRAPTDLKNKKNIVSMAVIGSGPAGLSAAIYGARFNRYTVVFEGDKPGGLLTETTEVENWPGKESVLGPELVGDIKKQALKLGAIFSSQTIEAVDFSSWPYRLRTQDGKTINALSVVISTGARPKLLGLASEQEYMGRGVSSCATCDAPFFQGEEVIVVGGGDSAVEEAIQLSQYAKKVTVLVRKGAMRSAPMMQDRLIEYPHIKVRYNVQSGG